MAKGLAVISGSNSVVFKALENGQIVLGQDVAASVTVSGSLVLDIEGKGAGKYLKSDASGSASWSQIVISDVSGLQSALDALDNNTSADLSSLETRLSNEEVNRSSAVSAEESARISAIDSLDTAVDTRIDALIGAESLSGALDTILEIQEFLNGDGAGDLVAGIGDLTSKVNELTASADY